MVSDSEPAAIVSGTFDQRSNPNLGRSDPFDIKILYNFCILYFSVQTCFLDKLINT